MMNKCRVEFEYEHAGRKQRLGTAIMKNRRTAAVAPGNPSKALIVELYGAEG